MRKNLSGWVLGALAIAVTLTLLACKGEITEPTLVNQPGTDDDLTKMIEGCVYEAGSSTLIPSSHVWWVIDPGGMPIGEDATDHCGIYVILGDPDIWAAYEGLTLYGYAEADGYETGECEPIEDFSLQEIPYWRDFYLNPE